ncbi:MAG TPA: HAD hydrolase family protein, partial [Gemmatimonadaceae bacterium]|nr:HAD hydrolase family protein [Gemmatimonadaceae bacterium]
MIDPTLAQRIALVAFDVDGTLTDNGVYVGEPASGDGAAGVRIELKRFDIQDGLGIVMLRRAQIAVAFISARHSASTTMRAAELGVQHVRQGRGLKKVPTLLALSQELGIPLDAMAFMGDDLADVAVMQSVGLSAAPCNSVAEVLAVATVRLKREGGRGAAREFVEMLLRARGQWDTLVADYVADSARPE